MTLPILKRKWAAAAALMFASAAVVGCAAPTGTATVLPSSVPTFTSIPNPTPTPTPIPELVLITESELRWESDLEVWASQRGWAFTRAHPSDAVAYVRDSQSQVEAIVSVQESMGGDLQRFAQEGIPVVAIDVPEGVPGRSLSTVGENDARHDQAGFLAGVMTGLASQTGWVGQVSAAGGAYEMDYSAGFTQGLLWGCPKCQLIGQNVAEMTLDRFRANSVDVVFTVPGPEASDVADKLASAGLPVVWIGEDGPVAEMRVGRVIFEEGSTVILALEALMATGEGRPWQPSIETQSIKLVDINAELLSPGRQRLLNEAYEAIAAAELDIGTDPEG